MLFASRVEITNIRRVAVCAGTGPERAGQGKADVDLQLCLEMASNVCFVSLLVDEISILHGGSCIRE